MTRKQKVASFIEEHKSASFNEWVEFQKSVPEIRLKKSGKSGVLINLEGKSGFSDPQSWLANYRAGCLQRLGQAVRDCNGVLTKDQVVQILETLNAVESGKDSRNLDLVRQNEKLKMTIELFNLVIDQEVGKMFQKEKTVRQGLMTIVYAVTFEELPPETLDEKEIWRQIMQKRSIVI